MDRDEKGRDDIPLEWAEEFSKFYGNLLELEFNSDTIRKLVLRAAIQSLQHKDPLRRTPDICLEILEKTDFNIRNLFHLRLFLIVLAESTPYCRRAVQDALISRGFDAQMSKQVLKIWSLNVPLDPETRIRAENVISQGEGLVSESFDPSGPEYSRLFETGTNTAELISLLVHEGVSQEVAAAIKAAHSVEPIRAFPEVFNTDWIFNVPRYEYSSFLTLRFVVAKTLTEGVPSTRIAVWLVIFGGLSPSFTWALIKANAMGTSYYETAAANSVIDISNDCWRRARELLEAGKPAKMIYQQLESGGATQHYLSQLDETRIDDERSDFTHAISSLLTDIVANGKVDSDLSVALQTTEISTNIPTFSGAGEKERSILHQTIKHMAINAGTGISADRTIVEMSMRFGLDFDSVRILVDGLWLGFSPTDTELHPNDARRILRDHIRHLEPPILYLRAHKDDLRQSDFGGSIYDFETELVQWMNKHSPVIALNNPDHTQHNPSGTYKLIVEQTDWRDVVVAAMCWSRLTVIRVNASPNLVWEFDTALKLLSPARLMLVFTAESESQGNADSSAFIIAKRMLKRHHPDINLPDQPQGPILAFSRDWQPRWFGNWETRLDDADKVRSALENFTETLEFGKRFAAMNALDKIREGSTDTLVTFEMKRAWVRTNEREHGRIWENKVVR